MAGLAKEPCAGTERRRLWSVCCRGQAARVKRGRIDDVLAEPCAGARRAGGANSLVSRIANRYMDSDSAVDLLPRGWFAAFKAASAVRAECEALLETMALSEAAWSGSRVRLCELEALRDALERELELVEAGENQRPMPSLESVMSAA